MRKIGKGNLKIIITLMTLILLSTQVAHSETPLYYKELLRIPIGDYRSILERMSTIFYLPFIESKEIERITEEVIERVKTELNIDFTRPEAVVHIKMIVGSGLRRGHSKEHIEKNVKQYPSYIIEVRKNSRNLHQKPSVKNPFKDNETGQGLISESELISILGKEIEKHFGVKLLEKIYIRTKWQEGTLNDHCYDPVFNEMFLDPRNIGYLWAIVEESIHSISGGFPSLVLDEGYTNILVRRIAREEILSESEYYDFLHYPIMQEAVNHLIRVVGEEGIALSYFTGDERYIKHTFGKNGELILSLLYALDDFYISGMGIFELDVEEIIRLIFENIHSEKNLKIIGNILILRYRYWKKSEYGDENKEIILKEIERLKGMLEKQPYLSYDISWSIFRDELRNLLEQSNNPFLVEIIRRLLSEEVKSRDILTDSLPDKEIFKGI